MDDEERQHIEELLLIKQRRLRTLELQLAREGPGAPPQVHTEFDDLQRDIEELKKLLGPAKSPPPISAEAGQKIKYQYPSLLAATYARRVSGIIAWEQAFQSHEGLRDMSTALIVYLAMIVLAQYRNETRGPGREDPAVEREIQTLRQPTLARWIALLDDTLRRYVDAPEPLLRNIFTFYYEQQHRDNPITDAITHLQSWLRLEASRKAPFAYRDLFNLLVLYSERPEGWASQGAVLASDKEYQERVEVLRPALERALIDLDFFVNYQLVYVQQASKQIDHSWSHRLLRCVGRDVEVLPDPLKTQQVLESDHLYLCRQGPRGGLEPFLDLYPLLACLPCKGCNALTNFVVHLDKADRLSFFSYSCGHRLEVSLPVQHALDNFLDLELWRSLHNPARQTYLNGLREVLADGEITPDERQHLVFLARSLKISDGLAVRLEDQIRREFSMNPPPPSVSPAPAPTESPNTEPPTRATPPAAEPADSPVTAPGLATQKEVAADADTAEAHVAVQLAPSAEPSTDVQPEPPANAEQKKLIRHWSQPTAVPVAKVALFGSPLLAFVAEESGNIYVYNDDRRLIYREHVKGRLFQVAVLPDRVLAGTWDGMLYCFGRDELLWQTNLESPISTIAVSSGAAEIVAGTWNGSIVAFRSNGELLWQNRLDDGICALSVAKAGTPIAAGSYAGHLALLDGEGEKIWLRDMQTAVVKAAFTLHAQDLIVATQDRMLNRINVENQQVVWECSTGSALFDFALSGNDRRLVGASRDGRLLIYGLNEEMSAPDEHWIDELSGVMVSPLSQDGYFILALSRQDGLVILDNRRMTLTYETESPASCAAVSHDGRYALVGGASEAGLYRLAQPDLQVTLIAREGLRRGHYKKLQITLKNAGERLAREIKLELSGPMEITPVSVPHRLEAGKAGTSEDTYVQPRVEGGLPINIRLRYVDDLGIRHEKVDVQTLDVTSAE
jgi:hypothetical protein